MISKQKAKEEKLGGVFMLVTGLALAIFSYYCGELHLLFPAGLLVGAGFGMLIEGISQSKPTEKNGK